ncbi:hypothetical protein CYMTET_33583 [Cymbomonas tetramitiformis]|uniref:Protein kinase domain-containing protein n=1 Tax=Cymbomonas tetramitiformis TaxID=36881 RepID=A0AAE0FCV9_9CHLO|nr:hypothetical protein CYMTET_33583 [Cymbomonas tetramitiformis]
MLKKFDNKENDGLKMFEARRGAFEPSGGVLPGNRSYMGAGRFPARRLQTTTFLRKNPTPEQQSMQNLPNLRQKAYLPAQTVSVYASCRPSTTPYASRNGAATEYSRLWTPKADKVEEPAEAAAMTQSLKAYPQHVTKNSAPLVPKTYAIHGNHQMRNRALPTGVQSRHMFGYTKRETPGVHAPQPAFQGDGSPGDPTLSDSPQAEAEAIGRKLTKREQMLQREVSFNTRVAVTDITLPTYDSKYDSYIPQGGARRGFPGPAGMYPKVARGPASPERAKYYKQPPPPQAVRRVHRPGSARRSGRPDQAPQPVAQSQQAEVVPLPSPAKESPEDQRKGQDELRRTVRKAVRDGLDEPAAIRELLDRADTLGLPKEDKAVIDLDDLLVASRVPLSIVQIPRPVLDMVAENEPDGPPWRLLGNMYDVLKVVGEGAYGMVMKSVNRQTGEVVAVKEFKVNDDDPDAEEVRRTSRREVQLLKNLNNKNIVRYLSEFYEREKLYVVMEFVPRNLLEVLEAHVNGLDKEVVRRCIYQLCKAMTFIHKQDIVYRDIKPENLLIDPQGTLKLCDFGFARKVITDGTILTDYVATRWYRAPELLLGPPFRDKNGSEVRSPYGKGVDMWAIGCLMGELTDGDPLFAGDSDIDQLLRIQKVQGGLTKEMSELFRANPSNSGIQFNIDRLDPLEHKYAGKMDIVALDFLKGLLQIDPKKRLTSEQCLRHPYFKPLYR